MNMEGRNCIVQITDPVFIKTKGFAVVCIVYFFGHYSIATKSDMNIDL